jgi:hypothetical protein
VRISDHAVNVCEWQENRQHNYKWCVVHCNSKGIN